MKKQLYITNLLMVIIALLPLAFLKITWNNLPEKVALHFNLKMEPDSYGSKSELFISSLIIAGVSILVYFLLTNIQKIDPKRRNKPHSVLFRKLAIGLIIFLTALNFYIIYASYGNRVMTNLLFPLMGLLFAFIGNYMNNLKPNYFAGFRLPWTLSDDNNWRLTHHLAGKIWFWGGLGLAILCFFLPAGAASTLFISVVIIMALIPTVYSYSIYKKNKY